MAEFMIANMAPLMFGALVVFLLCGYPVAFSLAANGIVFGLIGMELGLLTPAIFQALPERIFGIMANDTLLAIPFFTFMGLILERSGMAEDLLDTIGQLFGSVRGGLAYAVIFVGALLAATTGVVAASVISMGLISLPIMLRYGYDKRLASGVIAASGTLAQIIPPSLVLIIMADQLGKSVGDMYKGAFVPGLILTGLYAGYVLLITLIKPNFAPALPVEARVLMKGVRQSTVMALMAPSLAIIGATMWLVFDGEGAQKSMAHVLPFISSMASDSDSAINSNSEILILSFFAALLVYLAIVKKIAPMAGAAVVKVNLVLFPPLMLIILVLGVIAMGIATPTEGGAMGAMGAIIIAVIRKRLDLKLLKQAMETTGKLTSFVVFILVGSTVFGLIFRAVNGDLWVEHLLLGLPGGQLGFLIVVNLLVFLLAFFLDFFELSFIIVPLLAPVADKLGIDLVWFGVLLAVNMQTSFMHPPFGFALFYLRSVAPASVKTTDIYWGAIPFVCIQLIMVALIIIFPNVVSYGDDAQREQQRLEKEGKAPEAAGLDSLMKQSEEEPDEKKEGSEDSDAAALLKKLQSDAK
jgi:TRAP-type mannitol/chloroaromatic compound transport system permease large subunit